MNAAGWPESGSVLIRRVGRVPASTSVLPMFPLGSVLLPAMVLPLHVFEERYRALVEQCLEGSSEFGVVLIERGSEVGGGDVRSDVGTVARIVEVGSFADGRYALVAVGTRRIRVRDWLEDDPFPRAVVEDWPDPPPAPDLSERMDPVLASLRRVLALAAELGDDVVPATLELDEDPVLALVGAVVAAPVGPADRQRLLTAPDLDARLRVLGALLAEEEEFLARRLALEPPGPDAAGGSGGHEPGEPPG